VNENYQVSSKAQVAGAALGEFGRSVSTGIQNAGHSAQEYVNQTPALKDAQNTLSGWGQQIAGGKILFSITMRVVALILILLVFRDAKTLGDQEVQANLASRQGGAPAPAAPPADSTPADGTAPAAQQ